jgi:hypothetical protein
VPPSIPTLGGKASAAASQSVYAGLAAAARLGSAPLARAARGAAMAVSAAITDDPDADLAALIDQAIAQLEPVPRAMSGEAAHPLGPDGDDSRFDTGVAHVARVYDYWLGRKVRVVDADFL